MKTLSHFLVAAGMAGLIYLSAGAAWAQGLGSGFGGNFDPAQFRQQLQRMLMENYRRQLEVTNDAEWTVIEERVQKVLDARMETGFGGVGGMIGMFGRVRRMEGNNPPPGPGGAERPGLPALMGSAAPEETALQKAIADKASSTALSAAISQVVAARKAKQARLEKAQDELRQVLSVRQEAIALMTGLL